MSKTREPRVRFEQDAPARVATAVRAIRALRNLAGPGGKPEEWERVFDGLQEELDRLRTYVHEKPAGATIDLFGDRGERDAQAVLEEIRGRSASMGDSDA